MTIYYDDEQKINEGTFGKLQEAAAICAEEEGLDPDRLSLSLTFASEEEIHQLNREYRGVDRVTDVLSFPQFDPAEYEKGWDEVLLGDVVICTDVAKRQAEEYGHSYERELVYLFVHSCFHLLGYDHETEEEKAQMRQKEETVMEAMSLGRD